MADALQATDQFTDLQLSDRTGFGQLAFILLDKAPKPTLLTMLRTLGYYLHPEAFGLPKAKGIEASRHPEIASSAP
jgi:hypothetical protein